MSSIRHFTYPSADHKTQIHAIEWACDGQPRAIVQLVHGMQEFIDRYDEFARYLNGCGFLVVGNDHLGHGSSIADESCCGYFAEKDGNKTLIADIRTLHRMTEDKYPGTPYFIFGHSMGSFLARQYICMYGKRLTGAVICGTAYHPAAEAAAGQMICRLLASLHGWKYQSMFVTWLAMGSFNKKFEPARTKGDWLTRDEKIVDAYLGDARTQHMFTLNAYYNMFVNLKYLTVRSHLEKIPRDLPVLVVAGEMDAVGSFGSGPKKVAMELKSIGLKDVSCVLYPHDRHEILNELDRQDVYRDLQVWFERYLRSENKKEESRR